MVRAYRGLIYTLNKIPFFLEDTCLMFRFRPNRMKGGVCLLVAMHGIASTRFFRRRKRLPFVMWEWSFLYCSSGIVGKDILYYVRAMVDTFMEHGNYQQRAKARTRYMQDTLGIEGYQAAYQEKLDAVKARGVWRLRYPCSR